MVEGENHPSFIGYVADRIVVKFDKAITAQMNNQLMQQGRAGIAMLDRLAVKYKVKSIIKQFPRAKKRMYRGRQIDLSGWHKIRFRKEVDVEKVVAAFKKLPGVIDAQPIGIHAVYRLPNDPYFIDQWHLEQVGGPDIDAPEGWDFETGSDDIVVAVLDTGVQYYHKDLGGSNASVYNPGAARGNMWINWAEASGTRGVDDDGNGFTDDWIGWDFVELSLFDALFYCWADEDCFIPDNDPRDFHGHGTHIAGIISAINNNDYGVTSTVGGWGDGTRQPSANGVKIMPLRIGWADLFDPNLGYVSMDYAAQAFYYAADNGAHAANCSWGSSNSGGLGDAIDYFQAAGGLIFKAAGNSPSGIPDYMGGRADIINVAATGTNDCKASFSNFGNWVDVSAPGIDIWSTWYNYVSPADDFVARFSGTSMASPMALSVAASIWSQNPSWNADQVKQKLFDTADYIDGLSCNSTYAGLLGAGRVNAYIAVGSCEGDLNGDGVVDGRDLADLISEFNCTTDCGFDMTYDDMVNAADMAVFAKDFGRASCP
jgi:subtilisin family serine protease